MGKSLRDAYVTSVEIRLSLVEQLLERTGCMRHEVELKSRTCVKDLVGLFLAARIDSSENRGN